MKNITRASINFHHPSKSFVNARPFIGFHGSALPQDMIDFNTLEGNSTRESEPLLAQQFLPEVTELVLWQLDVEYLKACRLVCKSFNDEACRILKMKGILQFQAKDMEIYSAYCKNNLLGPPGSLVAGGEPKMSVGIWVGPHLNDTSVFKDRLLPQDIIPPGLPLMSSVLPVIPLTSLSIQFPVVSNRRRLEFEGDCKWLLTKYSHILSHIALYFRHPEGHMSDWLTPASNFPALECLEIRTGNWLTSDLPQSQHFLGLAQLLSVSPKLRTLKVNGRARIRSSLEEQVPFNFLCLKHLEIVGDSQLFGEIMDLQPRLHLESLVVHSDENIELHPFLAHFAPTLIKLKICEDDFFKRCPTEHVPNFPVLTHLFAMETSLEFGEPWLLKMPSLKCLCVRRIRLDAAVSEESLLHWEINGPRPPLEVIRSELVRLSEDLSQRRRIFRDFNTVFPLANVWYLDTTMRLVGSYLLEPEVWQMDVVASDVNEMRSCDKNLAMPSHFVKESTHMFYWNNDACFDGRRWAEEVSKLPPLRRRKLSETIRHARELNFSNFREHYGYTRRVCSKRCDLNIIISFILVTAIVVLIRAFLLRKRSDEDG